MSFDKRKTINVVLMDGGVGDHVASMVAIDYISRKYPWITQMVWVPDLLLDFASNILPTSLEVFSYSQMKGRYLPERPTKSTKWDGITSPMKIHTLDYAFLKLCDENPPLREKNFLKIRPGDISKFSLPEKFVVITTGFTADVREFRPEFISSIVQFIHDNGYQVVFLGQREAKTGGRHVIKATFKDIDLNVAYDLRDKTSLSEAAWIMRKASCVLGVDNGLLHVAGCTDTPIIGGFTTVSPEIRMPVRYNELGWRYYPVVPEVECKFCQERTNFLYGHDYRYCLKRDESKLLCTRQMTSEKFIEHLKGIL